MTEQPYDLTGTKIGQYEIRDLLEDNGLILTYQAYQPRLKRVVALQTLAIQAREDARLRQGLERGAELMARLEHASIVPVIDYGEEHDIPYIVTRSMQGGSLYRRLHETRIALNDGAGIIRQIAGALDYVHTRGLVHGDPCSRNIGFDQSGSAYMTDFLFNGMSGEAHNRVRGSKRYMAPELWRDERPTPASDQYALAAVAYHILAGDSPFAGESREEQRDQHLKTTPARIHHPEVPDAVDEVLWRGLAKNPIDRYASALDFARDLEKALKQASEHVFISYSRGDTTYAHRLREHFEASNLQVWIDAEIEHGDQWFNQINTAIKTCGAFVVVMTPDAEESEWVQKEILLAKRYQKPILPLLLRGSEFPILIDLQFGDVREEKLPDADFHLRLSRAVHGVV